MPTTTPPGPPVEALRAQGRTITLADGSSVQLRYSLLGMAELEGHFGTIGRAAQQVKIAANKMGLDAGWELKPEDEKAAREYAGPGVFSLLIDVLAPGLMEAELPGGLLVEDPYDPDTRRRVARILSPSHLQEYLTAFGQAFVEATESGPGAPAGARPTKGGPRSTPGSPSRTGGRSRSASAGSTRTGSGA